MLKAREILRLKHEIGLSLREIGQACSCGKSTAAEVLRRAENAGICSIRLWKVQLNKVDQFVGIYLSHFIPPFSVNE